MLSSSNSSCVLLITILNCVTSVLAAAEPQESAVAPPVVFTVQQDHQNMMEQLGITKLRPGRDGNPNAQGPNAANYDESKANPYPNLPDPLVTGDGTKVQTADQWWNVRRPEIARQFEQEVVGCIPENVPNVRWEVRETREKTVGGKPAIERHIVGVVDNAMCPEISVEISMSLTIPKECPKPIPVLMLFGRTPFEGSMRPGGGGAGQGGASGAGQGTGRADSARPTLASKYDQLFEAGWGYAILNPTSVQDDSGGWRPNPFARRDPNAPQPIPTAAGLTRGIIGLCNKGQPRKPNQWGSLRAWAWAASRGLDYLETVPEVDAKKVGIDGVSRYGKAALVTLAFDQRFAAGLIASAGEGGTSLYRRNFGESVENLTGSGQYHWMAGNFLKYGAEESTFGRKDANDLPIDAHQLIALCAPRLTFISYGIPEKGDALWLDQQGSFMATIAAQPVFRVLGARDLGRSDDYNNEKMPPVNVDLLNGQLAWRQHDGGHTDDPNVVHFANWANRMWKAQADASSQASNSKGDSQAAQTTEIKTFCNPLSLPNYPIGKFARDLSGKDTGPEWMWRLGYKQQFRELADVSALWHEGVWYLYPSVDMAWVSRDHGATWKHHPLNVRDLGYAPTIVKHRNRFLLMASDSQIYAADNPLGPFEPIGKMQLVRNGKMPSFIDPMLFSDDDKRLFYYWGCSPTGGIWGVELDANDPTKPIGEPKELIRFAPDIFPWEAVGAWNQNSKVGWMEGAWLLKHQGKYYLTFSAGGTENRTYAMGCYIGDSPLGPFLAQSNNPILRTIDGLVTGTAHGCVVAGPDNQLWTFYTVRAAVSHAFERRLGMDRAEIGADGQLRIPAATSTPQLISVQPHDKFFQGLDNTHVDWLPLNGDLRTIGSSNAANLEGRFAVDNSMLTWWQPSDEDIAPILTTDFLEKSIVRSVRIIWRDVGLDTAKGVKPRPIRYRVELETGKGQWATIVDRTQSDEDLLIDYRECSPTTGKRARLVILDSPQGITPAVAEFTLFGSTSND